MTYILRINSYNSQNLHVEVECSLSWYGDQQHMPVSTNKPIRGILREQIGYKIGAKGTLETRNEAIAEAGKRF